MTETDQETLASRTVSLSIFPSADALMPEACTFYWDCLAKRLCKHEVRKEKDGLAFTAALFYAGRMREPEAVREVTALIGDFHGIDFEQIKDNLQKRGVEFIAYSTFHHSKYYPRYRIFVPLEKSLAPARFRIIWPRLQRELFLDFCQSCVGRICQTHYFPSCIKGAPRFSFHNEGRFYVPPL